jgi:parvulin-like peptidyl-prolyl isomerase
MKMKQNIKNVLLLVITFSFSHFALSQTVFSVGAAKVSVEDFKKRLNEYKTSTFNPPTADQLLEDWIRFEVGVQEADKEKLQNDPAVKERFRQVLYNALLEKTLGKKVETLPISESELKANYRNNPEVRLSHIFIEYPANATAEQRETAKKRAREIFDDVKKQMKAGRTFEELAKLYSDDLSTKDNGGDMGVQTKVTLVPESFYTAVAKMKIGEVNGLLESRQGFHIVKVTAKSSYDDADKRQIRAAVFDEKRAKLFNEYFDKLKKSYKIQVNKDALKAAQQ